MNRLILMFVLLFASGHALQTELGQLLDDFKACGKERNYEDFQFRSSILSLIADHLPEDQGVAYAKKLRDECRVTPRSIEQRGRAFDCMFAYKCTIIRKCDNQTDPTNQPDSTTEKVQVIQD